jgi:hypothetical protein
MRVTEGESIQEGVMKKSSAKDVIEIPKGVWETAETKEDLEDWLLAHNLRLVRQLRRIRRHEDLVGRGKPLGDVARRWNIKL